MNTWLRKVFFVCGANYLVALSLFGAAVLDSPDYYIQSFGIPDGLPHEMVHHIVQDKTGYLWISTSSGLVRFDGNEFQTITSPLLNDQQSDLLYAIAIGTNGNLYAAPNTGGLMEYDAGTKSFHQIVSKDLLPGDPPTFLKQTPDGAFWLGDFQMELRRYKDGRTTLFTNEFAPGQTISVAVDASNRVWVASDVFLGKFHDEQLQRVTNYTTGKARLGQGRNEQIWLATRYSLEKIENGKISQVATNVLWAGNEGAPTAVIGDSSGIVWIGTRAQGLYRYADGQFSQVPTSHPWITDLFEDNEGNIWATTHGGGLDRIRRKIFSNWNFKIGVVEAGINSVSENSGGDLWMADIADNKIIELPQNGSLQEFKNNSLRSLRIASLDSGNNLWIATRTTVLKWPVSLNFTPQLVCSNKDLLPRTLFCADGGDMWVGGDDGFLGRMHKGSWETFNIVKTNYSNCTIRDIGEDGNGNLWMALSDGDLLSYRDGQFVHFGAHDGLPISAVHCMLRDSRGWLWMTTTRDGLLLRHDHQFYRVTTAQGFPSGVIDQMQEDNFGRIWFATEVGFYHIDRDELVQCALGKISQVHPVAFGRDVGLVGYSPVSDFQPTSCKSKDGLLVFATHKGVISINPSQCRANTNLPPVLVDEILVNDEKISIRDNITLTHDAKKIEFKISAIEFSAPNQVKVRHWLEGFDSTWIDEGGQRSFSYPRLPPGKYVLKISACNPDGIWNETVAPLTITVLPAWWQLHWVQIGVGILAAAILTLTVRRWSHRRLQLKLERLEQKQAMERERARIAKNLHDDLGGTLTEIGLLADLTTREARSPEKIKSAGEFFSERVRGLARTLDTIVWTVNPKNDSLDELATYLCGFSQELFALSRVRCRIDMAGDIPPIPLTPEQRSNLFLTAKEAMSNIVKHSGATEARLRIKMEGDCFCVSIEDNGRGFQPDAMKNGKRNGLTNMRSRIEELHGLFSLSSVLGKGTAVSFSIRLDPNGHTRRHREAAVSN